MKKAFAILLSLLVLFNTLGIIILFSAESSSWKEVIAEELNKKILDEQLVQVSGDNVVQLLDNNELLSGGKLYDIAYKKGSKNNTVFYCYHDTREESMKDQFVNNLKQNSDNASKENQGPVKSFVKRVMSDYIPEDRMNLNAINISLSGILEDISIVKLQSSLSVLAPPPKS